MVASTGDSAPTTTDAPTTSPTSDPLEVVAGTFLGIGLGSPLADGTRALAVAPVTEQADQAVSFEACLYYPGERWMVYAGGLTLVWEGQSSAEARLTNWQYKGGAVAGFKGMVARNGVTVGDTRQDILAAYDDADELGDTIVVDQGRLRFGLDGDTIVWFGVIDCGD